MSVFLSPGVFTREIDLSLYIPNLSSTALGCVGVASKGPINVPTYVTDPVQFGTIFGDPADPNVEFQPATYAALQYLHTGRQLWFVRVAEGDSQNIGGSPYLAKYATTTLQGDAQPPAIAGTTNSLVTLTNSNNVMTFVIDGGPSFSVTFTVPGGSIAKSIPEIVNLLNQNVTFGTYMVASTNTKGGLTITGKFTGSSHSLVISGSNMTNNIFGFTRAGSMLAYTPTVYGTGTTQEAANILGSGVTFPLTIAPATNDALVLVAGATALAAANVPFTIPAATYADVNALVTAINNITIPSTFSNNFVASAVAGQLKIAVSLSSSYKYLALGVAASNDAGSSIFGGINGKTFVLSNNTTFPVVISGNGVLTFDLIDFTTPANNTTVTVTLPDNSYADVAALVSALGTDAGAALFAGLGLDATSLTVGGTPFLNVALKAGSSFNELVVDMAATGMSAVFGAQPTQKTSSTVSATVLTIQAVTQGTWGNNLSVKITPQYNAANTQVGITLNVYEKNYQVEGYRNLVFTPLTVPDPLNPTGPYIPNPLYIENAINGVSSRIVVTNATSNTEFPQANVLGPNYPLSGGTNGGIAPPSSDPSLYIGVSDGLTKSGLQFFRNPEELDINLIIVPGVSDAAVINEMIDICQTRGDCMAIVDPPMGYNPQQVVDWVNGAGSWSTDHQAFNSSYAALYWPWLQVYDPVNKTTVFTPPSGHISNVFAYTDFVSDPWIAPAGLTRGRLVTPLKAEYNPTAGERDLLYLNNINPIATFIRDGINVFGQKTLQRKPSALDRVNVRRMLLYLEKVITTAARQLLFEPDDQVTWLSFVNLVEPFMKSVESRRGLTDFEVRCDATTNTPDAIDRSEMHALIFIKPTKAAEFIQIDFVLTSQSAAFNELVF